MKKEECIGYIKYEGVLVKEGLMDARKQAQALLAIDHALRYFIAQQIPEAHDFEFEIPVKVREGSWVAEITTVIASGLGAMFIAYCAQAGYLAASNDFKDASFLRVVRKAQDAIKWLGKIAKHTGITYWESLKRSRHPDDNSLVGICNADGEYIYVPKDILDMCLRCDPQLLEKLAENIEDGRELIIGSALNGKIDEVTIRLNDKGIFFKNKPEVSKDILFPELWHGKKVILEGEVISENKTSNSMGFKYKRLILMAYPISGNIVPYKHLLFLQCKLKCTVSRIDEKEGTTMRKPKLHFSAIKLLEKNKGLFE